MPTAQISAYIAEDLKSELDRFARVTGQTRAHVVEQALRHHLQALTELPPEAVVPRRMVLTSESAALVADRVERPRAPTEAMTRLFRDR